MAPRSDAIRAALLLLCCAASSALGSPFNVIEFGASPSGTKDSTQAFKAAWGAACATSGEPKVVIPKGTYWVGPVEFLGPCNGTVTTLQLDGDIVGPSDLAVYNDKAWIRFRNIDGLVIAGAGKFDGRGPSAWPLNQCPKNFGCKLLPSTLSFSFVNKTEVRNITSVNSKFFHMIIFQSRDVKVADLKIQAPGDSPNTDGIHIGRSRDVDISGTTIGTGDDCISIGDGNRNITITRVRCGPGHGISVGSLGRYQNEQDVTGVTVRNCTFVGTENGVRIKTWKDSTALSVRDLLFEDIVMKNASNPIIIDQEYCPFVSCGRKAPSQVKISGVKFRNIRGVSATKTAVKLKCSRGKPCDGVEIADVDLKYDGEGDAVSACDNVELPVLSNVVPKACAGV